MLKLMYITNKPWVAKIAQDAGVDWIFIDMEWIGKSSRQGGMDTVQNHHTFEDVSIIKQSLTKSKVLVRVNPIHLDVPDYPDSRDEIEQTIAAGADIVMLPYFKTIDEVVYFIEAVKSGQLKYGRDVKTCLLVETPQAAKLLENIVDLSNVDMIHFGLNDMHLALDLKFMFQLLSDGYVDQWSSIVKSQNIPFGFGGLASLNGGAVPGSMILKEHYRLGSSMVILSRAFCNTERDVTEEEVREVFNSGIAAIRELEKEASNADKDYFATNKKAVKLAVDLIINNK